MNKDNDRKIFLEDYGDEFSFPKKLNKKKYIIQ